MNYYNITPVRRIIIHRSTGFAIRLFVYIPADYKSAGTKKDYKSAGTKKDYKSAGTKLLTRTTKKSAGTKKNQPLRRIP